MATTGDKFREAMGELASPATDIGKSKPHFNGSAMIGRSLVEQTGMTPELILVHLGRKFPGQGVFTTKVPHKDGSTLPAYLMVGEDHLFVGLREDLHAAGLSDVMEAIDKKAG